MEINKRRRGSSPQRHRVDAIPGERGPHAVPENLLYKEAVQRVGY